MRKTSSANSGEAMNSVSSNTSSTPPKSGGKPLLATSLERRSLPKEPPKQLFPSASAPQQVEGKFPLQFLALDTAYLMHADARI